MPRIVNLANLEQFAAVELQFDGGAIGGPKIIPQCAEITLNWFLADGKLAHNVLHGRYAGGYAGTQAQANSILTGLTQGGAWTALAAFIAPTTGFGSVSLRNIAVADQPIITSTVGGSVGTSTGTELPDEIAVVVTKRTALTGRANRGRIYIPGWATNSVATGNVVAAAAVTALNNWAATIKTTLAAQGYTFVIGQVERKAYVGDTGTSHPARLAGTVEVTTTEVRDNHFDSQRRRGLR